MSLRVLCARRRGSSDDLETAEAMLRSAVAAMKEELGEFEPPTLHSTVQLGLVLLAKGELEEAEAVLRDALHGSREALGDQHPQVRAASQPWMRIGCSSDALTLI